MFTWCSRGHAHWGARGAAGLMLAREGTVLLQLRARWVHRGGTWAIPGGALERHETPTAAALREAEEELGVPASAVTVRGSRTALCGGWSYETVLAEPIAEVAPRDRSESDGHRWVPWADVAALDLHPGFRSAWEDPDAVLRDFVAGTAPS